MSSLNGTIRLISEDALYFFGKVMLLYVVLPLTVVWVSLELLFGAAIIGVSISATAYFFIVFFAVGSHLSIYKVAIGLGSTRTQLLKAYYGIGLGAIFVSLLLLNILQFLLQSLFIQLDLQLRISHPWEDFAGGYHFFSLLGMDLLFGIFLFGVSFLLYSIFFRLGMRKTTFLFMSLLLIGMLLYYGGYLGNGMEWVSGLDTETVKWLLIAMLGVGGIGAILLSYPIMRNASLHLKTRRD